MAFKLGKPIATESDRATALLLGAILEQGLEIAILSHCIPMDPTESAKFFGPPEGSPMTLDIKIRMAYAIGIYGTDTRDDLECIRHVRNLFAHAEIGDVFYLY